MADLLARHALTGRVDWIGLRPARRAPMRAVPESEVTHDGLVGDHGRPGKRALTLIQAEHLPVIVALSGVAVSPDLLRRNLLISRLNLSALRGREIAIGAVRLRITGPCAPCSRMEEALGPGGYTAVRGHGGITAEVLTPGMIRTGMAVEPL
ncbi:sulfurase [Mesobaculum littorinae]|uniref:Sulfurase n=1 Tax=Mesobaculum littorinae TaxID=2486419 RepID=A0A438ALT0_9RHOB|nr:MOSC domain-containing protein [Mesobaculum littorinae]RVV99629.1 sulfurase [Mesobaculum littorinae]